VIEGSGKALEDRVLVLAPTARDAALTRSIFDHAAIDCFCCDDVDEIVEQLENGGSAVLLPEESIDENRKDRLHQWLVRQAPWSDLPILVIARPGADSASVAQAMDLLGNVTVLERPTRVTALVSAVRTAIRARRRQYQTREHLLEMARSEGILRDADRRKDEFLATLAHELRGPLAPIRNMLEVLKHADDDPALLQQARQTMDRQVGQMVRLVDDLLDVSRITRDKLELRSEPVELASIIHHVIEACGPMMEAAGQRFSSVSLPDPVYLKADPARLAQVLGNLLTNASKYTGRGGRIGLLVDRTATEVFVRVQDTGIGIPPEQLERVFEMFTQVDRSFDRTQGGLGIGLTLAKRLVEMHGGQLTAKSAGLGRGSEFTVQLPVLKDVPAEPAKSAGAAIPTIARRILVVDDNKDAALSLAKLLSLSGHQICVAHDGIDAVDQARAFEPDAILLDIGLPKMSGYDACRLIRQLPGGQEICIIALTGWGQDEDRRKSKEAGFDGHLVKPVDFPALTKLLSDPVICRTLATPQAASA